MLKLKLFSESLELRAGASTTQNQYPFVATITYGGKISDGFVGGTEGIEGGPYKVLIPAQLLRDKIKSLAGKSVLVSDDLDSHQKNYKIGTFLQAWVESEDMPNGMTALVAKASGLIQKTDENESIVEKVIDEARAHKLGFSYDIKNVKFELRASTDSSTDQYVEVTDFEWRGATILKRDAAAYEETQLAASKIPDKKEDTEMTPEQIREALLPLLSPIQTAIASIQAGQVTLQAEVNQMKAGAPSTKPEPKGDSMNMKDFAATLAAAQAEANKPLIEAVSKLTEAQKTNGNKEENTGNRRTMSGAELSAYANKYGFNAGDVKELSTSADYRKVIDSVCASQMPNAKKEMIVAELGAQRRYLAHVEFAAQGFGGGN